MSIKLYNSLSNKIEVLSPIDESKVGIYTCGPTVYDHAHIGNLLSFIVADLLNRVLEISGYQVHHVMNLTDVDDKTINKSRELYPSLSPEEALKKLTRHYEELFYLDLKSIGINVNRFKIVRATENIEVMKALIVELINHKIAYLTNDGVYFSIKQYQETGHHYGQLVKLDSINSSQSRIDNDDYDKDNAHDFALWKIAKPDEPYWPLTINDQIINGRPGWHIECSAMSKHELDQPYDIHTGGIDLKFPHHENEIAQSTALGQDPHLANFFLHNEHLLVEGKKMSKRLGNFYTLKDITDKGFSPLAFRMLVMQSHYRHQLNFSWDSLESAETFLKNLINLGALKYQIKPTDKPLGINWVDTQSSILSQVQNDLNTAKALAELSTLVSVLLTDGIGKSDEVAFTEFIIYLDAIFGLELDLVKNISDESKELITKRDQARQNKDFKLADQLRDELIKQGIGLNDSINGSIWYYV